MILSLVILTNFYNKCLYLCRFLYTTVFEFSDLNAYNYL